MPPNGKPRYLADAKVDGALDAKIRALLTTCFVKPQDAVFQTRRYFHEPYPYRWIIEDEAGAFIAHMGAHDKIVRAAGKTYRIAGIAEVCVRPDHRGQGLVRTMLRHVHRGLARRGFDFAVLFGEPKVYASSGYANVDNLFLDETIDGQIRRKNVAAMVHSLSKTPWPRGRVHLSGPTF